MSDGHLWRHPTEREELVARLIRAEHGRAIAERKVRALSSDKDATALATRVDELEAIVARLNAKLANRNQPRKQAS
jgi:uncharacterized protein YceH (UPF0502 family)